MVQTASERFEDRFLDCVQRRGVCDSPLRLQCMRDFRLREELLEELRLVTALLEPLEFDTVDTDSLDHVVTKNVEERER